MAVGSVQPFILSGAVSVAATGSVGVGSLPLGAVGDVMVVTNTSAAAAYVAFGGNVAAIGGSSTSVILPGSKRVFAWNAYMAGASVLLASGTGAVVFELGSGTVFS